MANDIRLPKEESKSDQQAASEFDEMAETQRRIKELSAAREDRDRKDKPKTARRDVIANVAIGATTAVQVGGIAVMARVLTAPRPKPDPVDVAKFRKAVEDQDYDALAVILKDVNEKGTVSELVEQARQQQGKGLSR